MGGSSARLTRRGWLAAFAIGIAALTTGAVPADAAEAPIRIVINQSPWLDGFAKIVQAYEKDTGNKVALDVNPYAGSLEKQRNAVRSASSDFDILIINGILYAEMYHGGFLTPLNDIDPNFKLDPQVYTFDDTLWFDPAKKTVNRATGKLMTVPVNPNITMMFYRKDLYAENKLKVPETWEELLANAKALNKPPAIWGITQRAARATIAVSWDYWPYLLSFGGSLFRDEKRGDFTVTFNSPEAKKALDMYIKLAREAGPKNTASLDQSDLIQYITTGRSAHAVLPVAAQAQMEDPNKSIVTGKIGYAGRAARAGPEVGAGARPLARRHSEEHRRRQEARRDRLPRLVPEAADPNPLCRTRRHTGQRRRLPVRFRQEARERLYGGARRGPAARQADVDHSRGSRIPPDPGSRPQPRRRRRDHPGTGAQLHGEGHRGDRRQGRLQDRAPARPRRMNARSVPSERSSTAHALK